MRMIGKKELLLVIGYALLYIATRECSIIREHLSVIYGQLPSGMRFAALLFMPPRLWPYILTGDLLGSLYFRVDHLHDYGAMWLAAALIFPPLSAIIPAGYLRADHWLSGDWTLSVVAMKALRACGLAAILNASSGVVTLNLITYSATVHRMPQGNLYWGSVFTLGNYLGLLVIVPFALSMILMNRLRSRGISQDIQFGAARAGSIALKTGAIIAGLLAMNWVTSSREIHTIVQFLMFAPAVWMTVRYGWTGAVITSIIANFGLQISVHRGVDTDLLEIQVLMALVSTALLLLGAALTESKYRSRVSARESGHHLDLARRNLLWGEARLRRAGRQAEHVFIALQAQAEETAEALQLEHGATASALLRWHGHGIARSGVRNVIESMQVSTLESKGLRAALIYGAIATELREANISFAVRSSKEVNELPTDMQVMIYRLAYDLVMMLCRDYRAYRVSLRLRHVSGPRRNIALVIKVWPGGGDMPPLPAPCIEIENVRAIAQTYKGLFHDRRRGTRPAIGIVLRDF